MVVFHAFFNFRSGGRVLYATHTHTPMATIATIAADHREKRMTESGDAAACAIFADFCFGSPYYRNSF